MTEDETPSSDPSAGGVGRKNELELLRRRVEREHNALRQAEEIAERATRDLYDRQVELTLLGAVASASNQAGSIEDALSRVLNLVGEHMGWPVADARLVDPDTGRLVPTDIWYLADEHAYEPFREATEARSYSPEEGLPGQVLSRAEPIWIEDIAEGDVFVRRAEAIASGLRCAFAVPIIVGDDGVGVMEFLTEAPTPRNEGLLALMTQVGTQLGRVVERDRNRTSLQALADELATGNEELARSNADLQTFASVASHDLSEPLRTTAGFLELLRERGSLEGGSLELLEQAIAEIDRLKGMITGVLEFARAGGAAVRREPVQLGNPLELAITGLREQIAASAADIEVRDALPVVNGDLDGLRRVFQNLISNAIKFVAPGTTPRIVVGARLDGAEWLVSITDNGIGIDPADSQLIFGMFRRSQHTSDYEGNGIGLPVCARIIEAHGGRIWVEPGPDGGSVMCFTLPDPHAGDTHPGTI
jgi:signal transduction histidine kinase